MVLQVTSSHIRALHLSDHGMREPIWPHTEHPVPPIPHGHGAIASMLLPQSRFVVCLSAVQHTRHLLLLADRVRAEA